MTCVFARRPAPSGTVNGTLIIRIGVQSAVLHESIMENISSQMSCNYKRKTVAIATVAVPLASQCHNNP